MQKPLNYAVMVDCRDYQLNLKLMTDVMVGKSAAHGLSMDYDTTLVQLQACIDHYLQYILGPNPQGNIGFEYYLQSHFQQYQVPLNDPEVLNFLNGQFATVVGVVAHKLRTGLRELEFSGQQLRSLHSFTVKAGELQMYTLIGEGWS